MKNISALFCICISLIGCDNKTKVDILAEAEAIRNLENQWVTAILAKDLNKIEGFCSPDVVQMMPDKAIMVGLQSLKSGYEEMFADTTFLLDTFSWKNEKVEVSTSGDLAYASGTNRFNMKTPDGIIEVTGKGVDIWKKIDGEWKCVLMVYN